MAPPWPLKNRPKKDGHCARRLIFHVSWPPLSEVSGSTTGIDMVDFEKLTKWNKILEALNCFSYLSFYTILIGYNHEQFRPLCVY